MGALDGRVAIVTGASSGIGAAASERLAAEGATLVVAGRRRDRLESLCARIGRLGGRAIAVAGDLTHEANREAIVGEALRVNGRIDLLVNNAGWGQRGPLEAIPIERVRENFETNVFAPLALTQAVVPHMRDRRSGRIINISSIAGKIARPFSSVYDATKHATEAFSDGLREELAPFGIAVIVIEPGFIATEFTGVAAERELRSAVYAEQLARYRKNEERARKLAGSIEEVAHLIFVAAVTPRPRARYATPSFARFALLLRRLLPDEIFYGVLVGRSGKNRT